jgi:TPP-dependent 2-oxoacid decarboxylase
MVGVEVRRYALEERVAELARRLRIPVVTSFMGRGLLAHAEVPLIGTYLGLAGDPQVSAQVERLGRAAAAGRDRLGHQLRRLGAAHGPAPGDPRL